MPPYNRNPKANSTGLYPQPLFYRVKGACVVSGLGETSIRALIRENKLVARKAGGRTLIEAASLHSYLNGLPRLHGGGAA